MKPVKSIELEELPNGRTKTTVWFSDGLVKVLFDEDVEELRRLWLAIAAQSKRLDYRR